MVRPAAFLDRDGTVIVERGYLSDPTRVDLIPGAARAMRDLAEAGFALVLITNQSGIARGYYTEDDYRRVEARVEELLGSHGVALDGAYFCPHHPDFTGACECRKPGTGLYRQAAGELGLDLAGSLYVGDRLSDVLAARELGGRGLLVKTGYGAGESLKAPPEVGVFDDLRAAVAAALRGASRKPVGGSENPRR